MSSNVETKYSFSFRCSKCKKDKNNIGKYVEATGVFRGKVLPVGGNFKKVQYKCNECGHIGWSKHIDMINVLMKKLEEFSKIYSINKCSKCGCAEIYYETGSCTKCGTNVR